jgi:hypothetical protein
VPKDFGNKKLTWTLTAHEETNEVPARLHPDYVITPLGELAQGNTPPAVNFQQGGPSHIGPPHQVNASFTAIAAEAIELTLWAMKKPPQFASFRSAEDASVLVQWSKYRGPGTVTFSNATPEVRKTDGKATTTAKFQDPGDYILRVQASTASDRGSNQCCRTNALVRVTVSAGRN